MRTLVNASAKSLAILLERVTHALKLRYISIYILLFEDKCLPFARESLQKPPKNELLSKH